MRLPIIVLTALLGLMMAAPACADDCDHGPKPRRGQRLRDWLKNKPVHRDCMQLHCGAGKTHHDFGCTGFKGECIFVFGSCWQFFEEPCYPRPRPPMEPYPYPHPYPYQKPPTALKPDTTSP